MKRINQYKKLFKVEGTIELRNLKKTYRGLVSQWHPDKFQEQEKKAQAEIRSTEIIDGYHFLVSIAPKTKANNLDQYAATISEAVVDFQHKSLLLEVTFTDGNTYEYFGVNKKLFNKFASSRSLNNLSSM